MKLITERTQIRDVASQWRSQYPEGHNATTDEKYKKLLALDAETATAQDVTEIIGNDLWCEKRQCNECGDNFWNVVQVGKDEVFGSYTALLCFDCVKYAMAFIDGAKQAAGELDE